MHTFRLKVSIEGFTCHHHTLFSSDRGNKPPTVLKKILYLLTPQKKPKLVTMKYELNNLM